MAAWRFCITMVFLSMTLTSGVVSFWVKIYPTSIQAAELNHFVRCTAEPSRQPLSSCQFSVWYVDKQQPGAVLDVTKGVNTTVSEPNPFHNGTSYTAELLGRQFQLGGCDIRFHGLKGDHLLIGCKLTTTDSHLSAINTTSYLNTTNSLSLHKHSAKVFVKPGDRVNVALKTNNTASLSSCTCKLVNQEELVITPDYIHNTNNIAVYKDNKPVTDKTRYTLFGGWLGQGKCGFTIDQVTQQDNGVFFLLAHTQDGRVGVKAVTLLVAGTRPPSVVMELSKNTTEFDVGEVVTATCTASGVRLAATRWSWWWRNLTTNTSEPIPQVQGQSVLGWSWPWQEEVTQSLTLALTRENSGKALACRVGDLYDSDRYMADRKVITIKKTTPPESETTRTPSLSAKPIPEAPIRPSTTTTSPASEVSVAGRPVAPTTVATSTTTAPTPGSIAGHNTVVWIALGVSAALLAVVVVTAAILAVLYRTKVACFKSRPVQPAATPTQAGGATATAQWSKAKTLRPKATEPPTETATAQWSKAKTLRPKATEPPTETATAQIDQVQYAEIVKPQERPESAQNEAVASVNEEVAYLELEWNKSS